MGDCMKCAALEKKVEAAMRSVRASGGRATEAETARAKAEATLAYHVEMRRREYEWENKEVRRLGGYEGETALHLLERVIESGGRVEELTVGPAAGEVYVPELGITVSLFPTCEDGCEGGEKCRCFRREGE